MNRPPLPPFTAETAAQKARMAEDAWNTRDPARVALAYTTDSRWRNRAEFIHGRAEIEAFLTRKWKRELDYRLIKEVWTFRENRIAVPAPFVWRCLSGSTVAPFPHPAHRTGHADFPHPACMGLVWGFLCQRYHAIFCFPL